MFDKDGSGSIDMVELRGVLKSLGQYPTPVELADLLQRMDANGNGVVDFDEFAEAMLGQAKDEETEQQLREVQEVFALFDADGSGLLSVGELQRALRILGVRLSRPEAELLMQEVDADGDGEISCDELLQYVLSLDEEGDVEAGTAGGGAGAPEGGRLSGSRCSRHSVSSGCRAPVPIASMAASALSRVLAAPPKRAWARYIHHLERSPRLTKSCTSVVAACLGDFLAQKISHWDEKSWDYDFARTARMAFFNAGMGVLGHEYYQVLDGRVMPHASKSLRAVAMKIGIDQFMFAPVCTSVFYFYKVLMEGRPGDYFSEVQEKLVPTLLAGYRLWIPAHVINFALVPNRQRILYANVVSIFGTYILSRAQAGDYNKKPSPPAGKHRHATSEVVFDGVMIKED
ncbi:Calmodulin [Micractinium conductrix]|uniref:Calmodulin n=1 Tax=Micractinium conductrix TaxID=554055 RepID=A0A2P6VKZ7_9CHLO|nr:Calmodulin [Micractinium conductrix]|eukprot:PSC74754.1 Calmodulin [Micractinium conductrix]